MVVVEATPVDVASEVVDADAVATMRESIPKTKN